MSHVEDCLKRKKVINEDAKQEEEYSEDLHASLHEIHEEGSEKRSHNSEDLHASLHENYEGVSEKRSPNGDIFVGSCRSCVPDGFGKYLWANGCIYQGDWIFGKATGIGKISWPSGATYDGEFSGGNIHGVGMLIGHNMTYKGSWVMNAEHGLGRKLYANGDVCEGLWKKGVQDGLGRYTWKNGNVYFGDWKKGTIFGKGSLTWASKDLYDGQWQYGQQHGHGTYTWADGSSYIGTWSRGKKDGKGTFYPPGTMPRHNLGSGSTNKSKDMITFSALRHPHSMKHRIPSVRDKFGNVLHAVRRSKSCKVPERRWGLDALNFLRANEESRSKVEAKTSGSINDHPEIKSLPIVEREYAQGVLIREFAKDSLKSVSIHNGILRQTYSSDQSEKLGETIVKGHRSYDLMRNLQVGIRYSIGRSKKGLKLERASNFNAKEKEHTMFPRKGSQKTPPHESVDFKWIDYCPMVFRKIRQIFKIDEVDYLISLCGSDALRELSSPGKSGSVFYLSNDDRYLIKTLQKSEVKVLLKMLQNYYDHICKHSETLITKFFGLHQVLPEGGKKIQVVVMGNIFCTELRIHRKYDLKGSLQGRSSKNVEMDEAITLKDLDLDCDFFLEPSWRLAFFEQVRKDCLFLESEHIMDYSVMLGVHFRAPGVSEFLFKRLKEIQDAVEDPEQTVQEASPPHEKLALVAHRKGGSVPHPHVRGSPLKVVTDGHQEVDLLILGTNVRLQLQLGVNMPAMAISRHPKAVAADHTDGLIDEVYDVIINFGIIDILQQYGLGKKFEHAYKALKYGSNSFSAVNPHLYAERLQEFIHKFFPPNV